MECQHEKMKEDYYGWFYCENKDCDFILPPWAYDDESYIEECHSIRCTCETCIQNHPEREIYFDEEEG